MPTCQKKFEHPKRKNKGRRKNTIKQTKIVKEVHTGRNRWKATGKVQNPGNGLFSLPYISHNVHYTKIMLSKNKVSSLVHFEFRNLIFQMALIWFHCDGNTRLMHYCSITLSIQRLCTKILADGFVIDACCFFTAFFAAEPRNVCLVRYKALFRQYCRTI